MRIIGVGSPFGVDRFAWDTIERLKCEFEKNIDIELFILDRPGLGLIDYFNDDFVIVVDAIIADNSTGEIMVVNGNTVDSSELKYSSHEAGLSHTLALARTLDVLPTTIKIIGPNIGNENTTINKLWVDATIEEIKKQIKGVSL